VFTGLVRATGRIVDVRVGEESREFEILSPLPLADLTLGASVAVQGVCLTVTRAWASPDDEEQTRFTVQAAFETLAGTPLGSSAVGRSVNLEPSLRVGDALGGHFVSGHVDGVGAVASITERGEAREIAFTVAPALLRFIATKGSVAIDGVSLTVNDVDASVLRVGLIPHTLGATTLGGLAVGDAVNVEVDVVARYVARLREVEAPSS